MGPLLLKLPWTTLTVGSAIEKKSMCYYSDIVSEKES